VRPVWITQAQVAEILGCHVSLVAKLVSKGELTSRGRHGRASLDRDQVLALRAERERRAQAPKPPRTRTGRFEPPDAEHDWLTSAQAADLLGVSAVAATSALAAAGCRSSRRPGGDGSGGITWNWSSTRTW
jgi:hypothetical protein